MSCMRPASRCSRCFQASAIKQRQRDSKNISLQNLPKSASRLRKPTCNVNRIILCVGIICACSFGLWIISLKFNDSVTSVSIVLYVPCLAWKLTFLNWILDSGLQYKHFNSPLSESLASSDRSARHKCQCIKLPFPLSGSLSHSGL